MAYHPILIYGYKDKKWYDVQFVMILCMDGVYDFDVAGSYILDTV